MNEEGTEAAAATVVGIRKLNGTPEPFSMTVDHPFIFIIRDKLTGSPLFLGTVVSP